MHTYLSVLGVLAYLIVLGVLAYLIVLGILTYLMLSSILASNSKIHHVLRFIATAEVLVAKI